MPTRCGQRRHSRRAACLCAIRDTGRQYELMETERISLVLAGGGARGAYEAGALSMLLPELESRGQRPSTFVGTSVGAINAAYLAATQHLPAQEAADGLLQCWRQVSSGRIMRPLYQQLPLGLMRYTGEVFSLPGMRLSSLLDPGPLQQNLQGWIDPASIHHNIADGLVTALAVVTTAVRRGRTVVFIEGVPRSKLHKAHVIDYIPSPIEHVHLRASAAIPVLFPAVRIDEPDEARGWYVDGGTRLTAPIKPALDLGADRVVVIGTDAITRSSDKPGRHEGQPPDIVDGALHLLEGAMVDPLSEDILTLGNINLYYSGSGKASEQHRRARGKAPYRRIPYVFVAPPRRGAMGQLALDVLHSSSRRSLGMRSLTVRLLSQLFGGESPTHGELISYLFFDQDYLEELITLGQQDAKKWLDDITGPDAPWLVTPLAETNGTGANG